MIGVTVRCDFADGAARLVSPVFGDSAAWTAAEARAFVWRVWAFLGAHACESLVLREVEPAARWRVEFVADTGSAATEALKLSSEAVAWLQSAVFELPRPRGVY